MRQSLAQKGVWGIPTDDMKKVLKIVEEVVDKAWLLMCLILLAFGVYSVVDTVEIYGKAMDNSVLKYKPDTGDEEENVYKDLGEDYKGWITIDDTTIDYPVMQGKTNDEYLNKDPYGQFSLSGSIFLDSRNSADFKDSYNIVYGHHMQKTITAKSVMFGAIDDFYDKEYFKEHRTGLLTVGDRKYELKTFAIAEADASSDIFNTETSYDYVNQWLSTNAIYYDVPNGNKIMALSTCKNYRNGERTILFVTYNVDENTDVPAISDDIKENDVTRLNNPNVPTSVSTPVVCGCVGLLAIIVCVAMIGGKKSKK
mgnify:FL=1